MMKIAKIPTTSAPAPLNHSSYLQIAALKSAADRDALGRLVLPSTCSPNPDTRNALSLRLREIDAFLSPGGEDRLIPLIGSIMATLVPRQAGVTDAKAIQRIYAADLADLPYFAVEKACADFRQGRAGDGHWAPTQAEIRKVAIKHASAWKQEQADLRAILTAKINEVPVSEGLRLEAAARVKAAAEAARAGFQSARPPNEALRGYVDPTEPVEDSAKQVRDLAAEYKSSPISLSPAMRAKLNPATKGAVRAAYAEPAKQRAARNVRAGVSRTT